jgi:outer membrane protein W
MAGLSFYHNKYLFNINYCYTISPPIHYNSTPILRESNAFNHWSIGFSAKYTVDFTQSAEKDWESGRSAKVTQKLATLKKLNSWTLSAGASSSFYTKNSPVLMQQIALPLPFSTFVLGDFGLGYYSHNQDFQFQFLYRKFNTEQQGFGEFYKIKRHSMGLEGSKFYGDYHGFVPFLGAGITYNASNTESSYSQINNTAENKILGHAVLGWDIRPNRLQYIYLRTNIRYNFVPKTNVQIPISKWEINFIQAVILINRFFI